jgi:signal transduction histidine kinase
MISFDIAALDFAIPSKNKYAYKLEGFRDDWVYRNADNRTITFTILNPGEYTLWIKAANNDGVWNNFGRSLKLIITPPYYSTWWFRIAAFAVLLLIIFVIYEIRLKRLLDIERTRIRIAGNLHDDVGGALSSIQYFAKALGRDTIDTSQKDKFTNLIIECTTDAQDKIKDIIWTVNPEEDDLEKLIIKFNRYASDLLESNDIKYEIDYPSQIFVRSLDMEKRQHIWCICKETLINVIKHSQCKNVKIDFELEGKTLKYTIDDDGTGFETGKIYEGNGVDNIKKRVELISAEYSLQSSEGSGTSWHFSFKI